MGKPTILIVDSQGLIDNIFNMMTLELLRVSLGSRIELEKYEGAGKISEENEIEMYALIAGELEEAVYDATTGVEEAKLRDDSLVESNHHVNIFIFEKIYLFSFPFYLLIVFFLVQTLYQIFEHCLTHCFVKT